MATLRTLDPVVVTPAILLHSSIAEDEHPQWVAGTNYEQFTRVIYEHYIYEDGVGGVSTKKPTEDGRWIRFNPSNQWRPFDTAQMVHASATGTATYEFLLESPISGFIALDQRNVDAMTIEIRDLISGDVIWSKTLSSIAMPPGPTWFDWLYGPYRKSAPWQLQTDMPSISNVKLVVTCVGTDMKIGPLLFGAVREWGEGVLAGLKLSKTDHSINEVDAFGARKYAQRGWSQKGDFQLILNNRQLDDWVRFDIEVRGRPIVFIPSDSWDATIFYGRINQECAIDYPDYSTVSVAAEGVVRND